MWLRRAYFRALWVAVFVLPLWVFLGRAFFGAPLGYQFLAQILLVPLLFVVQVVATLLVALRPSARRNRAVSPLDLGALTLLWLGQLGIGFFLVDSGSSNPAASASAFTALAGESAVSLSTGLSAAAIGLTIVALVALVAGGIWQAVREARASIERAFDGFSSVTVAGSREPGWASDPEHTIRIAPRP